MARRAPAPKAGPGSRKVAITMREFAKGTLKDSAGNVVRSRSRALAIGHSKARAARKRK